jgi:rubrerythrin
MPEYSIREALEMAVQTEKIGARFYEDMAVKYKDDKELKDFFSTLSRKEHVHEKRFSDLKDAVGDKEPEEWELVSEYMRAIVESAFFIGKDKATIHMQNIHDLKAAIGYAVAFEKETLLFYYGIKDAVRERDIIDEIIAEERSHIMWLNKYKNR